MFGFPMIFVLTLLSQLVVHQQSRADEGQSGLTLSAMWICRARYAEHGDDVEASPGDFTCATQT